MEKNKFTKEEIRAFASCLGSIKTEKKARSSRLNGLAGGKSHLKKIRFFLKKYPYKLKDNEHKVKFPMKIGSKDTTYNPDFFCPTTNYFIEVATSKPNISEQGQRWVKCIQLGHKLKIFWWEGQEITKDFL